MAIWHRFSGGLRALLRRVETERDLDEELRAFVEASAQRRMRAGMPEQEARRAARVEMGSLESVKEEVRTAGWETAIEALWADLRYSVRILVKAPLFSAVVVLTLGLGIGANTAIFSFADAILLRPLPVGHPSEILAIDNTTPDSSSPGLSYPDYGEICEHSHAFAGVVAYVRVDLGIAAKPGGAPAVRHAMLVSGNFFSVLGIVPSLGRAFLPGEAVNRDRGHVAVLAYDFWRNRYGGDRTVLGRKIRLNGIDCTIIGVAPESFTGMERFFPPSVYAPLSTWGQIAGNTDDPLKDRSRHELNVKGRLEHGVSHASAQAELATIGRNLERAYPKTNHRRQITVETDLQATIQKEPVRLALVAMLLAIVGLVLIIACANVAGLMLARSCARSREIAIRLALGAGRVRLVRQLMTENLVIAALGGILGLGFGYGGIQFLDAIRIPSDIPFVLGLHLDARVLVFSLIVASLSCLLFGLAPALAGAGVGLAPTLKSGINGFPYRRRLLGRNALVSCQIALAMVLLAASAMLLDGFRKILQVDPGFRTDHLISMDLDPAAVRYSPERTNDMYRELADRVRHTPGVSSVTLAEALPLSPDQSSLTVVPEGYQLPLGRENATVFGGAVDENYFRTMHIAIMQGRVFDFGDREGSRRVAIVNEEFAKTYWPNQHAIGKRLRMSAANGPAAVVVGVAATGRYLLLWEAPRPYVYLPYMQNSRSHMTLIAESRDDPAKLAAPLREAAVGIDPDLPIYNLRTVASFARWSADNWLILLEMITAMGLLGLTLAMVGLYALISYTVSSRTAEIGIRIAVGAACRDVLWLVLGQGLRLAGIGIAIGGALTAAVAPALAAGLAGIGRMNVSFLLIAPIVLFAVSLAASYIPARRAAALDPVRALRYE